MSGTEVRAGGNRLDIKTTGISVSDLRFSCLRPSYRDAITTLGGSMIEVSEAPGLGNDAKPEIAIRQLENRFDR